MPRQCAYVLGIDLNRSESIRRPTVSVYRASQAGRACLERAADPLYGAGVNAKLFGNDADTRPSRSRQSLADSLFQCGGDWGTPKAFTLTPGPREASTDSLQQFACLALQSSRQGGEIRIRRSVWPLPIEPDRLLTQIDLADGVLAALMLHCAARFVLGHGTAVGRSKTYCR